MKRRNTNFLSNMVLFLIVILLGGAMQCIAQSDTLHNRRRLALVAAGHVVGYSGSMVALGQVWYSQYPHQSFRFFNDAAEWKQMDKMGHFYSAFHLSALSSRLWQWGQLPERKSDRVAAISSMIMMSTIEVFDGFSAGYGASASDLVANFAGTAFFLGQSMGWHEIRIMPKFSFHPTSLASVSPNTLGSNYSEQLIKNYNGQTYWLSFDMDRFIRFPKWLNVSVGYGAGNMVRGRDNQNLQAGYKPYRRWMAGLDIDLTAIHTRSKWVKSLLFCVNRIRIPTPALELSRGRLKGYLIYF